MTHTMIEQEHNDMMEQCCVDLMNLLMIPPRQIEISLIRKMVTFHKQYMNYRYNTSPTRVTV